MVPTKIHFTSLGCARNLVDTEVMLGFVLRAGYELTEKPTEADFLVVNTCGFLEASRQEGRQTIAELLETKKGNAKLIVAGCMVQKEGDALREQFPEIHYLLGSGDMQRILEAIASKDAGSAITSARSFLQEGEVPRQTATPRHFAYLKIAEGCAKRCAFCIIPKIKGPLRSKPQEQVLREFRVLLDQGAQEIILIAQDLGDYGKEKRQTRALEGLLQEMLKSRGAFWLRLLYLYPDEISEELIALMQSDPRLIPYLDMPIQHINDEILKAMRRKTNRAQIVQCLDLLRRSVPDVVIRTSLMVGFPGETEAQFVELLSFVQEAQLDNVGFFAYSNEQGAFSFRYPNQVPEAIKQERLARLAQAQLEVVRARLRRFIGRVLDVVVEGVHPDSPLLLRGRFYGQCPEIDGMVILNDARGVDALGTRYPVEITDAIDYDLVGRVLPRPRNKRLSLV